MERTEHVLKRVAGLSPGDAYVALAHMIQSGVKFAMLADHAPGADQTGETSPKHLRTGVNMAMCHYSALVDLLIAKNLFTREEYDRVLLDKLAYDVADYESRLSHVFERSVTLG